MLLISKLTVYVFPIIVIIKKDATNKTTLNLTDLSCKEGGYQKCPFGSKICYDNNDPSNTFSIYACIPKEIKCQNPKQEADIFQCKSGECTYSLEMCEPEEGYSFCEYMFFQFPEEKEYLCEDYLGIINCPEPLRLCGDGICRASEYSQPSQIACPIGTVLCPDLT